MIHATINHGLTFNQAVRSSFFQSGNSMLCKINLSRFSLSIEHRKKKDHNLKEGMFVINYL